MSKNSNTPAPVYRDHKDRVYTMLFSDKKELLALYNAANKTHYEDPDMLEINTLENAVYLAMRNDISFLIDSRLGLYEHQSTYSPNLPLRFLFYVADLYSGMVPDKALYRTRAIRIPTPRFIIFYNGEAPQPDWQELKLSDLFQVPEEAPWMELKAVMLNINRGHNRELMDSCRTLRDYAEYVHRVRMYEKTMPLEEAVDRAITECIKGDILAEFLKKNRAEVKKMSIYEYNEEEVMQALQEDAWEDGMEAGKAQGQKEGRAKGRKEGKAEGRKDGKTEGIASAVLKLLERAGEVPEDLREKVCSQRDETVLYDWLALASGAQTVEEFQRKI